MILILGRQFIICVRLLMAEMQKSNEKWLRLFNGYIITLLAIFYFQTEKKLPAIHKLQLGAKRQQCGGIPIIYDPLEIFFLKKLTFN